MTVELDREEKLRLARQKLSKFQKKKKKNDPEKSSEIAKVDPVVVEEPSLVASAFEESSSIPVVEAPLATPPPGAINDLTVEDHNTHDANAIDEAFSLSANQSSFDPIQMEVPTYVSTEETKTDVLSTAVSKSPSKVGDETIPVPPVLTTPMRLTDEQSFMPDTTQTHGSPEKNSNPMARESSTPSTTNGSWYQAFMGKITPVLPPGASSPSMGPVIQSRPNSPTRDALSSSKDATYAAANSPLGPLSILEPTQRSRPKEESPSKSSPSVDPQGLPMKELSPSKSAPIPAEKVSDEVLKNLKNQLNSAIMENKTLSAQLDVLKSLNSDQQSTIRQYETSVETLNKEKHELEEAFRMSNEQAAQMEAWYNEFETQRVALEEAQQQYQLELQTFRQEQAEFELVKQKEAHQGLQQEPVSDPNSNPDLAVQQRIADLENESENIRLQKEYLAFEKDEFEKYKQEQLKSIQSKRKELKDVEDQIGKERKRLDTGRVEMEVKQKNLEERELVLQEKLTQLDSEKESLLQDMSRFEVERKSLSDSQEAHQLEVQRLEKLKSELDTRNVRLTESETQLAQVKSEYEMMLASITSEKNHLSNQWSELESQRAQLHQEQNRLQNWATELESENNRSRAFEQELKRREADLVQKMQDAQNQFLSLSDQERQFKDDQYASLQKERDELEQRRIEFKTKERELYDREIDLSQRQQLLDHHMAQLRDKKLDSALENQKKEILNAQIKLESERAELEERRKSFALYREGVEITFAQREAKLARLEAGTPSGLWFKDDELQLELKQLRENEAVNNRKLDEYTSRISLLEAQIEHLKNSSNLLSSDPDKNTVSLLRQQLDQVSHERDNAQKRHREMEAQHSDLQQKVKALEITIDELRLRQQPSQTLASHSDSTSKKNVEIATSPVPDITQPSVKPASDQEDLKGLLIQNMVEIDRLRTYLDPIASVLSTAGSDVGHRSAFESDTGSVIEYLPHRRIASAHAKSLNDSVQTRMPRPQDIVSSLLRNRSVSPEKRSHFDTDNESWSESRRLHHSFSTNGIRAGTNSSRRRHTAVHESDVSDFGGDVDTDASEILPEPSYHRNMRSDHLRRMNGNQYGGIGSSRRDESTNNTNSTSYNRLLRHIRSYGDMRTHVRGQPSDTSSIYRPASSQIQPRYPGSGVRPNTSSSNRAHGSSFVTPTYTSSNRPRAGTGSEYYDSDFTVRAGEMSAGYFTEDDLAGFSSTTRQLLMNAGGVVPAKSNSSASAKLDVSINSAKQKLKSSLAAPKSPLKTTPHNKVIMTSPERPQHRVTIVEQSDKTSLSSIQRSLFSSTTPTAGGASNVTGESTGDHVRDLIRRKLSERNLKKNA